MHSTDLRKIRPGPSLDADATKNGGTGGDRKRAWSGYFLLSLVLSALILFQIYPTFDSYFLADDFGWLRFVSNQPDILAAALEPSLGDWTTPLTNGVFWTLFRAFGLEPAGYYLVVALFHLVNGLLVFGLVRHITQRTEIAVMAALIFSMHFAHFSDWGPLVWISAFVQVIAATFYLLSLMLFTSHLHNQKILFYLGSLGAFGLALASKETAISLPALLFAWSFLQTERETRPLKRAVLLTAPFLAVSLGYVLYKLFVQQASDRYLQIGLYGLGTHILTNWKFFSNLTIPNPQSPPVLSFLNNSFPSWVLDVSLIALFLVRLATFTAVILLWWKGTRAIRFWILLSVIAYLPFIGFFGGHAGANRYFYLPAVGFSALLAAGFWWIFLQISDRSGKVVAFGVVSVLLLGLGAYNLIPTRAWQKQMAAKSQINQHVVQKIDRYLTDGNRQIQTVYLAGFDDLEEKELGKVLLLIYGAESRAAPATTQLLNEPPANSIVVARRSGQISISTP